MSTTSAKRGFHSRFQSINNKEIFRASLGLLIALHFFGLFGMHWPLMNEWLSHLTPFQSFLSLTPLNLLLTTTLLLAFHREWNLPFVAFMAAAILVGYFIEVAGVATGAIFGSYEYGPVLGPKWLEVPPLIGINWLLLVYAASSTVSRWGWNKLPSAGMAATFMVTLDYIIEPVAVHFDFWTWEGGHIPPLNFLGWFIVAFFLCYLFFALPFKKQNCMAPWVFFIQVAFFAIQNLLIS